MKKYRKPKSIIWDKANYYCVKICPRCELVRFRADNFVIKNYSSTVLCPICIIYLGNVAP